jgi:ABC-type multidrug transport system ATPase subunit
LIRPTFGEVKLFGQRLDRQSAGSLLSRVGALIEQPAFQSYLSGRDNLIAVGGYTGGIDPRRVDEVLGSVGLAERSKDRYSTNPVSKGCLPVGMGQAFSIALVWVLILAGVSTYLFITRDVLQ